MSEGASWTDFANVAKAVAEDGRIASIDPSATWAHQGSKRGTYMRVVVKHMART